jgi:hypothetical protein
MGWETSVHVEINVTDNINTLFDTICRKWALWSKVKQQQLILDSNFKKKDNTVMTIDIEVKYSGEIIADYLTSIVSDINAKCENKNIVNYTIRYSTGEYTSVTYTKNFVTNDYSEVISELIGYDQEKITTYDNNGKTLKIHTIEDNSEDDSEDE